MALLTVQQVADASENDVRLQLDSTTNVAFFIKWVDYIHKDVVYSTRYRHLAANRMTFNTTVGQEDYTLSPTDIRVIDHVYDVENQRVLLPDAAIQTTWSTTDYESIRAAGAAPKPVSLNLNEARSSLFYRLQTVTSGGVYTHTLQLLPAPATDYTGEVIVSYTEIIDTVTTAGATLLVSDDALPLMVSGVNALGFNFLKRPADATRWNEVYTALKGSV